MLTLFKSNFCRLISTKSKTYEHKSREVFGVAVMRFSLVFCVFQIPTSLLVCLCGTWEEGQHPDFGKWAGSRWLWAAQATQQYVLLQCILLSDWPRYWQVPKRCFEDLRLKLKSLSQNMFLGFSPKHFEGFYSVCVSVLTFFFRPLLLLPVMQPLPLWHQGSRGQYHMSIGIPQSLTTKQGGVVAWETPPHMGVVLHAVQVHNWLINMQQQTHINIFWMKFPQMLGN